MCPGVLEHAGLAVLLWHQGFEQEHEKDVGLLLGPLPGHRLQDLAGLLQSLRPFLGEGGVALLVPVGRCPVNARRTAGSPHVSRVGEHLDELGSPLGEAAAAGVHSSTSLG